MLKNNNNKEKAVFYPKMSVYKVWYWWGVGEAKPYQRPESRLHPLEGNGDT